MPKPIVLKTGGEKNLPPIETQISPFSAKLAALAAQQKQAFESLSPNAKKLHASICDSERYDAITDPHSGLIATTKRDISKCLFRMQSAVAGFNNLNPKLDLYDTVDNDGKPCRSPGMNEKAVKALRVCGMGLATVGRDLAKLTQSLVSLEAEASELEVRIMDDSNLPNFSALSRDGDAGESDRMAAAVRVAQDAGVKEIPCGSRSEGAEETVPEEAKPKPFSDDRPLYWKSRYDNADKVVAPTQEGAQAMVAMRIRKTIKDEDVKVWQVDESGVH